MARSSPTSNATTSARLRVTGKILPIRLPTVPSGEAARQRGNRRVCHRGRHLVARLYDRSDLGFEDRIQGSAIVEQEATTVWVLPGWAASVDQIGNLVLGPDGGAKLSKPSRRSTTKRAGGRRGASDVARTTPSPLVG
jgi:N-methylhydantoinase A